MRLEMSKRDIAFLSALGLSIASFVLGLLALMNTFKFNKNLEPTQANAFSVGTAQDGLSGVWFGNPAKQLTFNSTSNRFAYGTQSITTFQDLTSFSTITGLFSPSYGGFYSTENQYMGQVTASAGISSKSSLFYNFATVQTSDIVCSVTKPSTGGNSVSGDSKVYVQTTGVYKISTSVQFDQTANQVTPVALWLSVNGTDVPDSGSIVTIQQQTGESFPFVEFFLQLSATQFFEVKWNSFNTTAWAAKFTTGADIGSVSGSNVPSVITNIMRIG